MDSRTLSTAMTPRDRIAWFSQDDADTLIRLRIAAEPFSTYPVCDGDLDHLIGYVDADGATPPKAFHDLHMRLEVEKVRHLINPPGQWLAVCKGPQFKELAIHNWQVNCDGCGKQLDFEFAVDAALGKKAQAPAAEARITELGWRKQNNRHLCPQCIDKEVA